jgi:hypothetical protein
MALGEDEASRAITVLEAALPLLLDRTVALLPTTSTDPAVTTTAITAAVDALEPLPMLPPARLPRALPPLPPLTLNARDARSTSTTLTTTSLSQLPTLPLLASRSPFVILAKRRSTSDVFGRRERGSEQIRSTPRGSSAAGWRAGAGRASG